MAIRTAVLYAYSIHGRDRLGNVINYSDFLQSLSDSSSSARRVQRGDEVIALTQVLQSGQTWRLRFVHGYEGEPSILLDLSTGEEREDPRSTDEVLVHPAYAYVIPSRRFVAIEKRRPGLGSSEMARTLGSIGSQIGFADGLHIELNPVPSESFITELEQFGRIRQASIFVSRPNFDWDENAAGLTEYAEESDGETAQVEISAPRGGSLSKTAGIVNDIKNLAHLAIGPIKTAKIVGNKVGEARERTLSLSSHQERQSVSLDTTTSAEEQEEVLTTAAGHFLMGLPNAPDGPLLTP